jgi:hypothetical protein
MGVGAFGRDERDDQNPARSFPHFLMGILTLFGGTHGQAWT